MQEELKKRNHIPVIGCAYGYALGELKTTDYVVRNLWIFRCSKKYSSSMIKKQRADIREIG